MKKDIRKEPLIISLIGMSGSGKSRWSKKLVEKGFRRICCDDLIEQDLAPEMKRRGFKGIRDVARWMGHPYDRRFSRNQSMYLKSEMKVMKGIINMLKKRPDENIVIDTTGSVIYVGSSIMKSLRRYSLVIYLETPMSILPEMLRLFREKPKPVIWNGMFYRRSGETDQEALIRCYSELLRKRIASYARYADATLSYRRKMRPDFTTDDFLRFVQEMAKKKSLA